MTQGLAEALLLLNQDVPKLAAVTPSILRGGQPSKLALAQLADAGLKSVLTLRWSSDVLWQERQWVLDAGLKYFVIPLTYWTLPTRAQILRFFEILDHSQNHPILVHCKHGVDRTGMMIAFWRIARQGWTPQQAYDEMKLMGFHKIPMYHFKFAVFDFAYKWERWKKRGLGLPGLQEIAVERNLPD
jgi:protein tyrosine phosphatase (PTP) superfamily phosphohydrolase (DUF442 family)